MYFAEHISLFSFIGGLLMICAAINCSGVEINSTITNTNYKQL